MTHRATTASTPRLDWQRCAPRSDEALPRLVRAGEACPAGDGVGRVAAVPASAQSCSIAPRRWLPGSSDEVSMRSILQPRRSSERTYGLSSPTTVGWRTPLRILALRSRRQGDSRRECWWVRASSVRPELDPNADLEPGQDALLGWPGRGAVAASAAISAGPGSGSRLRPHVAQNTTNSFSRFDGSSKPLGGRPSPRRPPGKVAPARQPCSLAGMTTSTAMLLLRTRW